MAELAGCHDVLFDRCFDEAMKKFDPSTTGGLLAKLRRKQAMTFLHNSVSGKVWAYMRVMDYPDFSCDPFQARLCAIEAARRLPAAETYEQSREEIDELSTSGAAQS
ncbi:hypothetical protein NKR23_g12232 [Pleurostoma richardsiae]|jgi:hypothetical protein|uniref:Uncharacterized protein n=1 Tax=Pleurostoma richardsiae TaxID=41990 RepID=A0AA38VIV1_9PEZI|nr:hypothetical protein NKR23_g12232 [Pleurostoma richardsiae]